MPAKSQQLELAMKDYAEGALSIEEICVKYKTNRTTLLQYRKQFHPNIPNRPRGTRPKGASQTYDKIESTSRAIGREREVILETMTSLNRLVKLLQD